MPKPLDPQRFERAVKGLALYRAREAVLTQIRADGLKLSQFSSREINAKREAFFAAHMEELITQALADVWRMPTFARYRQTQPQPQPQPVR
jgi:hypothetical protein